MPVGLFDATATPLGWFDPTADVQGWWDRDNIGAAAPSVSLIAQYRSVTRGSFSRVFSRVNYRQGSACRCGVRVEGCAVECSVCEGSR